MTILRILDLSIDVKGILFDKDGTLLDFYSLWGAWAQALYDEVNKELAHLGHKQENGELRMLGTLHNEQGTVVDYDVRGPLAMGSADQILTILAYQLYRAGLPWNVALTKVREYRQAADRRLWEAGSIVPMRGLLNFLDQCRMRGLPLIVVTSDETIEAKKQLEGMNIHHCFFDIIGNDQVLKGKPDPEMALLACSRAGLHPSQVIMIGDTNGDMQMGKSAGVALTIGIVKKGMNGSYLNEADVLISDYEALEWNN